VQTIVAACCWCYSPEMQFFKAYATMVPPVLFLTGCTHGYALATLNVTPIVSGAEDLDVVIDITKSDDNGDDSKAASPGRVVTFQVAAGRIYLTASGRAYERNEDTGGDTYGCSGESELRVRWGRVYDIELDVECRYLWTDD